MNFVEKKLTNCCLARLIFSSLAVEVLVVPGGAKRLGHEKLGSYNMGVARRLVERQGIGRCDDVGSGSNALGVVAVLGRAVSRWVGQPGIT